MAEKATPSAQPDLRGLAAIERRVNDIFLAVVRGGPEYRNAEGFIRWGLIERTIMDQIRAALAGPEDGARSAWEAELEDYLSYEEGYAVEAVTRTSGVDAAFWQGRATLIKNIRKHMEMPAPPVAGARPSGEQEGESK